MNQVRELPYPNSTNWRRFSSGPGKAESPSCFFSSRTSFEEMSYADRTTAKALHSHRTKQIVKRNGQIYLFPDEIQEEKG